MRHVVLLNVAGHGYSTYAGSPLDGFREQPLGAETPAVSRSALAASRALDDTVRRGRLSVSATARHDVGMKPLVAYASFFPEAVDEKGRPGLVFVHLVELDAIEALAPALGAVIESLTDDALSALGESVASVARDRAGLDALLQRVCADVTKRVPASLPAMVPVSAEASELGAIEHDCAGAAPLAWLTLAQVMSPRAPGWNLADYEEGDRVYTRVRCAQGDPRRTLRASEVLGGGVREYLLRGVDESLRAERSTLSEGPAATTTVTERVEPKGESVPPRVETAPVRPVRTPVWLAGGIGAAVGGVVALVGSGLAHTGGTTARECDAGVSVVVREAVCDASMPERVTQPAAVVHLDAGVAQEDAEVEMDVKRAAGRGRDGGRARVGPRQNGVSFPVPDRPRPRARN
jgi:hypothetical protein